MAEFILNYLLPWLWVKCWERHWKVVEAFIKCSSGPGETLANVPIISGVVRHPSLCPKWFMFNASLQSLSFNLTFGGCGSGWLTESSHKTHKEQSSHAVILQPFSVCLTRGELLRVLPVAGQSPHSKPPRHTSWTWTRGWSGVDPWLFEALCYTTLCVLWLNDWAGDHWCYAERLSSLLLWWVLQLW